LLLPEAFLSLAEETGPIVPIGRFAMDQACRQLSVWHFARPMAGEEVTEFLTRGG
jgi:EAL domain-containing protein (putative c-di-GMP-specific phosphodiesterase class I)